MMHWKIVLIFFLFLELCYRLTVLYNPRLAIEPLCLTFIRCPNNYLRTKVHLGWNPASLMAKINHWHQIICQCRITHYQIYLFNVIGTIDVILLILILVNLIQRRPEQRNAIQ